MRRESLARAIGLFAVVVWVSPALAKDRKAPPPPAQVQQIFDCRAISDDAGRLACFDAQVASFEDAVGKQDVRIFDRAAADKARRSLFGFTLRDLPFFGDDDDGKEGVQRIESTIKWARREGYNQVRFEIEEGAVWVQADQTDLPRDPRPGDKIVIYPGAISSYWAEIGSLKRIRVRRER
ncbi:hypothetical protein K5P26_12035 [Sphingopyxis sp. XHP0097]|uniref:Uncharacterized protein n=1 Tax=Sphingopyxis jiangsuensis TaxID=2871171 RepID=A0ABS7MFY6_9SPHN|nr:hypothetical protein [Sphingopyxis jiangsuensis]MBY4637869.1 hypothetical protein [Sphingopyxis jiangsuensis]